jgi:hypothetical protein
MPVFLTEGNFRIEISGGEISIKVISETEAPGGRESLDKLRNFIQDLQETSVSEVEILRRKIPHTVGQHEPDCIRFKLA